MRSEFYIKYQLGFDSRRVLGIWLFITASRTDLVPRGLFPGGKADHSPQSSAEVKEMRGTTPPLPQYVFMVWCSVKHRDNFSFISYQLLVTITNHF